MRYGVIATGLGERLALALGKVPVPVIDVIFGPLQTRALLTAAELGVFEALAGGPRSAEEVAAELELDAGAVEALLRTLAFSGYVAARGSEFSLTRLARRHLVRGAAEDLTGFLRWSRTQWQMLDGLEEVLRSGRGRDFHRTLADPDAWSDYQQAMLELARRDAPWVAARVPVARGAQRLLDLGGGHGLYGALICRRHPPLRSTVLELPAALPAARDLARSLAIDDVVEHRSADLRRDDWGDGWDVVVLSNLLHHFGPDDVQDLLRRARAAVIAGATVAIRDYERPRQDDPVSQGDVLSLLFRTTSAAATYHASEYRDWLRAAGFSRIRALRPKLAPGSVLVVARA